MHKKTSEIDPRVELKDALLCKQEGAASWSLFKHRVITHHQAESLPSKAYRGEEAVQQVVNRLEETNTDRRRVLYVHVPYCQKICSFCAFFTKPKGPATTLYADALHNHIELVANTQWAQSRPFEAVYFGGGTPTALPKKHVTRLLKKIRKAFPIADDCEITIETRFMGMDSDYFSQLREAGANRLSFGLQTFNTELRQKVGRVTTCGKMMSILRDAASFDFNSISLDLIYNLPGQTEKQWRVDLASVLDAPVTGVSTYALIPFPNSPLMRAMAEGREEPLGGVEMEAAYFKAADQFFAQQPDWDRMSPVHFGKTGRETCVYNQSRLGQFDILGLGCGAGGSIGGVGYMSEMNIDAYAESMRSRTLSVAACSVKPSSLGPLLEAYNLLDINGIDEARFLELLPQFRSILNSLIELELVENLYGRLQLTADGCFWAYNITSMVTHSIAEHLQKIEMKHAV